VFIGHSEKILEATESKVNSAECSLCEFVIAYVDKAIQNNKSEAAVEAALEKVCTILPHALNGSCVQFVVSYGPILLQLLEKYGTPAAVCNALKLCKNGTEETVPGKTKLFSLSYLINSLSLFCRITNIVT
jgi:hypothetical protein